VLVEQIEQCFQLMEIRPPFAALRGLQYGSLGLHQLRVGRHGWDKTFVNPNISSIVMTYGYMHNYEDRVRRAMNTLDRNGRFALWQGGMEPNIPVGSEEGVAASMKRAVAGAEREQREGPPASGWPTGRWSTSSARSGRRWARPISWAAPSRR